MNLDQALAAVQRGFDQGMRTIAKRDNPGASAVASPATAYNGAFADVDGFGTAAASIAKVLSASPERLADINNGMGRPLAKGSPAPSSGFPHEPLHPRDAGEANRAEERDNPAASRRPASANDQGDDSRHRLDDPEGVRAAQRSIRALYGPQPTPLPRDRAGTSV